MPVWHGFIAEAGPVVTGRALKMSDLDGDGTEVRRGAARDPNVLYQDQVVVIEHGDKAIRSWAANGMEWTLDGSDPRINALKEDDVLFATSRCVGRVLKVTHTGNDVAVILGPAQFTDVIKQGNLAYDQPLDLNSLTAVEMPDYPGTIGSPYLDQMKQAQARSESGSGSASAGSGFAISHVSTTSSRPAGIGGRCGRSPGLTTRRWRWRTIDALPRRPSSSRRGRQDRRRRRSKPSTTCCRRARASRTAVALA